MPHNEEDGMNGNYEGPSINPRFQVQQPGGPYMRVIWDTWLNREAERVYGSETDAHEDGQRISERTQLVAETKAIKLNLEHSDPYGFLQNLALHLDKAREAGTHPGNLVEDVDKILAHYMGRLRGVTTENLAQNRLYAPAAWLETL